MCPRSFPHPSLDGHNENLGRKDMVMTVLSAVDINTKMTKQTKCRKVIFELDLVKVDSSYVVSLFFPFTP